MDKLEEIAAQALINIKYKPKFSNIIQIIPITDPIKTNTTPPGIDALINNYHNLYNKEKLWPSDVIKMIEDFEDQKILTPPIEDQKISTPPIENQKISTPPIENQKVSVEDTIQKINQKMATVTIGNQAKIFPQPKIKKRRYRKNTTQITILENYYSQNKIPSRETKTELALLLNMSIRQITVWFQNKRSSEKKKINKILSTM